MASELAAATRRIALARMNTRKSVTEREIFSVMFGVATGPQSSYRSIGADFGVPSPKWGTRFHGSAVVN